MKRDNCLCCTSSTGEEHVGRTEELHSILLSIPSSAFNSVKCQFDHAGGENYAQRDAGTNSHHDAQQPQSQVCWRSLLCFCLHWRMLSPIEDPFSTSMLESRYQAGVGLLGSSTAPCAWGIPRQSQNITMYLAFQSRCEINQPKKGLALALLMAMEGWEQGHSYRSSGPCTGLPLGQLLGSIHWRLPKSVSLFLPV